MERTISVGSRGGAVLFALRFDSQSQCGFFVICSALKHFSSVTLDVPSQKSALSNSQFDLDKG